MENPSASTAILKGGRGAAWGVSIKVLLLVTTIGRLLLLGPHTLGHRIPTGAGHPSQDPRRKNRSAESTTENLEPFFGVQGCDYEPRVALMSPGLRL